LTIQRFYFIELLRFLAATTVVVRHYHFFFFPRSSSSTIHILNNISAQPFYSFLELAYMKGDYAVQIFWGISGYIFSLVYLNKNNTTPLEFFANRFARLYPLHVATLLYVSFIQIINYKIFGQSQIVSNNSIYDFFFQVFFISGLKGESFNLPIWSVSIEIIVYIYFFLSIIYLKKFGIKYTIFIYITSLVIDKIFFSSVINDCLRLFFTGIIVYQIDNMTKNKRLMILYSIILFFLSFIGNFKIFVFVPGILFLFVGLEYLVNFRNKNNFNYLGSMTYSSYLLHIPIMLTIIVIFHLLEIQETIFLKNYFFIFYLLFIFFISYLCFNFFEKPLNVKLRKLILKV
jgi:peptidoglycan/LPS O-acetylase OafA/YrhL